MNALEKMVALYYKTFFKFQNFLDNKLSKLYNATLRGQHKHHYMIVKGGIIHEKVPFQEYKCKNCSKTITVYPGKKGFPSLTKLKHYKK